MRGGDERRVGAEVGAEVGQSGSGAGSISKVEIEISKDEIDGPRWALAGNGHLVTVTCNGPSALGMQGEDGLGGLRSATLDVMRLVEHHAPPAHRKWRGQAP